MRVVRIERFPSPSRNCGPNGSGPVAAEPETLRLHRPPLPVGLPRYAAVGRKAMRLMAEPGRALASLTRLFADKELTLREKRSLAVAALATRGAGLEPAGRVHEAVQFLRSRQVDRIECYSARDFPLVPALSSVFGVAYDEFLAGRTRYFGEFAFELFAVIPYAYWLHRQGKLRETNGCGDTASLYYFSPDHREFPYERAYVPVSEYPAARRSAWRFDVHAFPERPDTSQWSPPPYKEVYRNETFRWQKDLCIVCNKSTPEPSVASGEAVNLIRVEELIELLAALSERYQVVYVRPRTDDIVGDHQPIHDFGDLAAIEARLPGVLTIQRIQERYGGLSYNELQLKLFANCERFVSVLGGSSYLASYFGGKNIVLAREGWEVSCNAYENWFHLFSGAEVFRAATFPQLTELARREFTL